MRDVALSLRGVLRGFGLKMGQVTRKGFETRVQELFAGQVMLEQVADAMLSAKLHTAMLAIVRADVVCKRLTSVPGVGGPSGMELHYRAAITRPHNMKLLFLGVALARLV